MSSVPVFADAPAPSRHSVCLHGCLLADRVGKFLHQATKMAKGKSASKAVSGKRVKKVLSNNAKGITKGAIRRMARRGGVRRMSGLLADEVRSTLKGFVERTVSAAVAYTEHARKRTVTTGAVVAALKKNGRMLYGY